MSFDRRSISLTVPNPAATIAGTLALRSDYGRLIGFKALVTGTDTATQIEIKDADARVVYKDAADKDYKTAAVHRIICQDDTTTGLSSIPVDATGAAATAAYNSLTPIVRSPLTISLINGGTAGDVLALDLDYESLTIGKVRATLTTPNPAATVAQSINLRVKYAQVIALRGLVTGTDTATQIELKDADNRIFYKDAADKDYKTAAIDKTFIYDDTVTSTTTSFTPADATGAALALNTGMAEVPVVKSPITATWSNNGTAGDVLTLDLFYRA